MAIGPKVLIQRELISAIRMMPPETAYHDMAKYLREQGFVWQLHQTSIHPTDETVFVTFELLVGRDGSEAPLVAVDTATVQVPRNIREVTMAGRITIESTIIHAMFGRLPPAADPVAQMQREAPPAPPQYGEMNGGSEPQPMRRSAAPETFAEPEPVDYTEGRAWVPEQRAEPIRVQTDSIDLVQEYNEYGLPVFGDLYAMPQKPEALIRSAFDILEETLPKVRSSPLLAQLWKLNANTTVEFIKDLGTDSDKQRLKKMFADRGKALSDA